MYLSKILVGLLFCISAFAGGTGNAPGGAAVEQYCGGAITTPSGSRIYDTLIATPGNVNSTGNAYNFRKNNALYPLSAGSGIYYFHMKCICTIPQATNVQYQIGYADAFSDGAGVGSLTGANWIGQASGVSVFTSSASTTTQLCYPMQYTIGVGSGTKYPAINTTSNFSSSVIWMIGIGDNTP